MGHPLGNSSSYSNGNLEPIKKFFKVLTKQDSHLKQKREESVCKTLHNTPHHKILEANPVKQKVPLRKSVCSPGHHAGKPRGTWRIIHLTCVKMVFRFS